MDFITLALGGGLLYLIFKGASGKDEPPPVKKDDVKKDVVNTGPTIVNGTYPDAGMTMEQAQRNLIALGYKGKTGLTLTVDGKYGENTAYALKSFQAANGLAAHGYLDSPTADKLIEAGPAGEAIKKENAAKETATSKGLLDGQRDGYTDRVAEEPYNPNPPTVSSDSGYQLAYASAYNNGYRIGYELASTRVVEDESGGTVSGMNFVRRIGLPRR